MRRPAHRLARLLALLLGATLATPLTAPLVAQEGDDAATPRAPEIRTSATAERHVRPDLAVVSFSFDALGATPLRAGQALAARADSIRRALQALGIPRDSLVNGSRWYWWRGRVEQVIGPQRYIPGPRDSVYGRQTPGRTEQDTAYRAHDAIQVRIRDLRKVGPAIDSLLAHGVTNIGTIAFEATDVRAARDAALREATQLARGQAEAMADASGGRLGRTLSLSSSPDLEYAYGRAGSRIEMSGMTDSGGGATQVVSPSIVVRMSAYGRWELLPRP